MNKPLLNIYYDNPNKQTNRYIGYLKRDCEKNNINYHVINNFKDWLLSFKDDACAELYIEPTHACIPLDIKNIMINVSGDISTKKSRQVIINKVLNIYNIKYRKE